MYRGNSKILPIALLIIVTIVAIIALVSIGRALLGRATQGQVADDAANRSLLVTDADRSVRMIVRGPIVANEDFRSYEIEVSPIGRRMTTYKGYQGEVIEVSRLTNSTAAYTEFVNALSWANFTKAATNAAELLDVEGVCATGRLYTFEILEAQSVVNRTWASNCRDVAGSFRGNGAQIRTLFQEQIPNRQDLLRDLNI